MSLTDRATPAGHAYLDLQNQARRQGRQTQELLTFYAMERWLARLAASPHADRFVLRGGVLLVEREVPTRERTHHSCTQERMLCTLKA